MEEHRKHLSFSDIARQAADALGASWAFLAACGLVLAWALAGPIFQFSDAWQLVINTGTTIATFLMVFLIQNTQNRDARALHLKLDEADPQQARRPQPAHRPGELDRPGGRRAQARVRGDAQRCCSVTEGG